MGTWIRNTNSDPVAPALPRIRHVWVEPADRNGPSEPGLVVSWRREADGWFAQVALIRDEALTLVWIQAARLHPVEGAEPSQI